MTTCSFCLCKFCYNCIEIQKTSLRLHRNFRKGRKMCFSGLIVFMLVVFISNTIKAEKGEPYCNTGNSTLYPIPSYNCFNYKSFPVNLKNPEKLKTLYFWDDLWSNDLQMLKNGDLLASKTTNLDTLILSKCKIKEIEKGAFRGGNKLTQLGLAYNQIGELDLSVFEDLPNLKELWLHANPLKSFLHNSTFPNRNLTHLSLNDCRLRSINANIFESLVNLKELSLYGNQLTTIDWQMFRPLNNLQKVLLDENPFHCDCKIKFLLDYLDKNNIQWNDGMIHPSCSSSSFDDYIHIPSAENLKQRLILVGWNFINRQHLVCPPQVSSLEKSESAKNISINCKYSGYPQPTVLWRIDGEILRIDNNNKHFIETKAAEKIDEPEYNYKFIQTLSISFLPFSAQNLASQVTCLASSSVFKSTESNAVTVSFSSMQTTTVINTVDSKLLETPLTNGIEKDPANPENSMQATILIIIGAVAGLAVILVLVIFVAIRRRKFVPFYHFLPQREVRPPLEENPTGHVYDYIRMSWIHRQDADGYETPISLSIQQVPLPPLPQQHNPVYEANKTN